ncbi:hypothetical protein ACIRVK_28675 [Streptomyces sp. NPDC101152]|uniref:hypothetical protein n=1 Tax=Streptomyces sp. NPDC101152 TaxID=3366116 RepID=UPI003809E568
MRDRGRLFEMEPTETKRPQGSPAAVDKTFRAFDAHQALLLPSLEDRLPESISSMSRWARGVKRVTCPNGSGLMDAEQGGHLLERDRPFRSLGVGFVGQPVEPRLSGLFRDLSQALILRQASKRWRAASMCPK